LKVLFPTRNPTTLVWRFHKNGSNIALASCFKMAKGSLLSRDYFHGETIFFVRGSLENLGRRH
jgi:hypothetical protein